MMWGGEERKIGAEIAILQELFYSLRCKIQLFNICNEKRRLESVKNNVIYWNIISRL